LSTPGKTGEKDFLPGGQRLITGLRVHSDIPPPPPPEIIEGEEEWVVEKILNSKVINRKLQNLVKWKDFGIEHNSWEPHDNVHAPDLVADFH
jgi:hypothetical protein